MSLLWKAVSKKTLVEGLSKSFHTTPAGHSSFQKLYFEMCGYHKYGLLHDDLLISTDSVVKEAIRRLPEEEQMARTYRGIRATQADISHDFLPKDQWTKYEDNHNYLTPYILEVQHEINERKEWDATY